MCRAHLAMRRVPKQERTRSEEHDHSDQPRWGLVVVFAAPRHLELPHDWPLGGRRRLRGRGAAGPQGLRRGRRRAGVGQPALARPGRGGPMLNSAGPKPLTMASAMRGSAWSGSSEHHSVVLKKSNPIGVEPGLGGSNATVKLASIMFIAHE